MTLRFLILKSLQIGRIQEEFLIPELLGLT